MGQRSSTETIVALVQAFLQRRTWSQADLAKRLEVGVPAVKKRLVELQASGFPLERDEDHPHVYWSVPKDWFPGGILFQGDEAASLLRQLVRLPKSASRDRLLARFVPGIGTAAGSIQGLPSVVSVPAMGPAEEKILGTIEDAAAKKLPLRMRYFSASRGSDSRRHASVHRLFHGPPGRFIATCHRDGTLKWFRVADVLDADVSREEPFRGAEAEKVESFEAASLAGFHSAGPSIESAFSVRDPDARWVVRNLMPGMNAESMPGGIRVTVTGSALAQVARFVVSLGASAHDYSPELAEEVVRLAEGALHSARPESAR